MHALVRGSIAVALLAAAGSPEQLPAATPTAPGTAPLKLAGPCPKRGLPSTTGCLTLPPVSSPLLPARLQRLARHQLEPPSLRNSERHQVPRKPDRPLRFSDYQLPVDPVLSVSSSDDADSTELDASDMAIRVEADEGTPISLVELDGQQGQAEVVLVGQLRGVTVITRHRVSAPAGEREYLVIYGHLGRPGPRIVNGARLSPMEVIGFLGAAASDRHPWFSLEARLMREALQLPVQHLSELLPLSISTDVRNVLPLRK